MYNSGGGRCPFPPLPAWLGTELPAGKEPHCSINKCLSARLAVGESAADFRIALLTKSWVHFRSFAESGHRQIVIQACYIQMVISLMKKCI